MVQVNSSDSDFTIKSFARLIKDKVMWAVSLGTVAGLLVILYTTLAGFLKLAPLSLYQLMLAVTIAIASVIWYELVKLVKYLKVKNTNLKNFNS